MCMFTIFVCAVLPSCQMARWEPCAESRTGCLVVPLDPIVEAVK